MKKRIWSALLCLCMVVCMLPTVSLAADTTSGICGAKGGSNLTWTLDSSGTLTISGTGEMQGYDYENPNPWAGKDVRSLVVKSGVISIGSNAFSGCKSLTNAVISDSVRKIDAYAFHNCTSLKSITLPKEMDLNGLGTAAFLNCSSLESVSIPKGINRILKETFSGCRNLKNVEFPNDLVKMDGWAFLDCTSLKEFVFPTSLQIFEEQAFGYYWVGGDEYRVIDGLKVYTHDKATEEYCEANGIAYEIAHEWVTSPSVPATCTKTGLTEGSYCKICNEVKVKQDVIPKLEHKFTNYIYNNDAQIGSDGTETASCDYGCGEKRTRIKEGSALKPSDEPEIVPIVTFVDLEEYAYYVDAVWWAVENGITNGTSETTFSPNNTCTRAQVVTFLWRAKGEPEPSSTYNPFVDVPSNAYYYKAVLWAVEQGITNGTSGNTFSPDAGCTRGQVATFLWRAEGEPSSDAYNPFVDVSSNAYYYKAVLWAVEKNITNGMTYNTFVPDMTCTRGQIVTFLYRDMK